MHAKLLQSCPTVCNPMDGSPPGSSVHEILQAGILERVAILFSRGSSPPRDQTMSFKSSALVAKFFVFFFKFYFIFKLYNIVLVLPNIEMNPPQVYMCSPS